MSITWNSYLMLWTFCTFLKPRYTKARYLIDHLSCAGGPIGTDIELYPDQHKPRQYYPSQTLKTQLTVCIYLCMQYIQFSRDLRPPFDKGWFPICPFPACLLRKSSHPQRFQPLWFFSYSIFRKNFLNRQQQQIAQTNCSLKQKEAEQITDQSPP